MTCNIYIINLASSLDRKENITKQLDNMTLPYTIFSAIDGRKDPHPLFDMYDDKLSQQYRGKSLSKGQLGCYASHFLLWEECVKINAPIIIIEDDALIYPVPFLDFIKHQKEISKKYQCVRLFDNKRKNFCFSSQEQFDSLNICKFNKGHMSTTGYFITPEAARKLIMHSQRWYMAVDIYMDRFWVNEVECYGTSPACLTNDPLFDSEIGYGEKSPRNLFSRVKREWFSVKELLRRETHNFKYKMNHKVK